MSAMIETPVVVIDVQLAGPSTGVPTKTEQGDLWQMLLASAIFHCISGTSLKQSRRSPQPKQECCVSRNHLWDLVAVYGAGAKWEAQMPTAVVFNGPVVYVDDQIREALTSNKQ